MTISSITQFRLAALLFFVTSVCFAIWSFSLSDPNLVFSQWPPFWTFQQFMWQLPKQNVTIAYVVMATVLVVISVWLSQLAQQLHFGFKKWFIVFILLTSPLIFSNNALSHDVFNYMFNARMVVEYQVNPHVKVAMDYLSDPWTRFMHNVHTPAPYYYGWTAMSLIPYIVGFEKFIITYVLFRLWSLLGLVLSLIMVVLLMKKQINFNVKSFVLLLFSPLLIFELISNSHNDGWMMWPALASLYLVMIGTKKKQLSLLSIVISFFLLMLSISTKYVTILLAPVWCMFVLKNFSQLKKVEFFEAVLKKYSMNLFDLSSILLFLPLLTARSHQFNPWYLSWSLLFYPLMKNRFLKMSLMVLSFSSLYRYVPWMWHGAFDYTPEVELNGKLITWIPIVICCVGWVFKLAFNSLNKPKS